MYIFGTNLYSKNWAVCTLCKYIIRCLNLSQDCNNVSYYCWTNSASFPCIPHISLLGKMLKPTVYNTAVNEFRRPRVRFLHFQITGCFQHTSLNSRKTLWCCSITYSTHHHMNMIRLYNTQTWSYHHFPSVSAICKIPSF